jgi:hypothetical protein
MTRWEWNEWGGEPLLFIGLVTLASVCVASVVVVCRRSLGKMKVLDSSQWLPFSPLSACLAEGTADDRPVSNTNSCRFVSHSRRARGAGERENEDSCVDRSSDLPEFSPSVIRKLRCRQGLYPNQGSTPFFVQLGLWAVSVGARVPTHGKWLIGVHGL